MKPLDLEALTAADIPVVLEAVHRYLMANGLALITENIFLKTEALARRWELSESCLNHWRFTGGGPFYMKTGPGPKAHVRYPLLGQNGIMHFEESHLFRSTAQESNNNPDNQLN